MMTLIGAAVETLIWLANGLVVALALLIDKVRFNVFLLEAEGNELHPKQSCRLAPAPQSMQMRLRRLVIEAGFLEETQHGSVGGCQLGFNGVSAPNTANVYGRKERVFADIFR